MDEISFDNSLKEDQQDQIFETNSKESTKDRRLGKLLDSDKKQDVGVTAAEGLALESAKKVESSERKLLQSFESQSQMSDKKKNESNDQSVENLMD